MNKSLIRSASIRFSWGVLAKLIMDLEGTEIILFPIMSKSNQTTFCK